MNSETIKTSDLNKSPIEKVMKTFLCSTSDLVTYSSNRVDTPDLLKIGKICKRNIAI